MRKLLILGVAAFALSGCAALDTGSVLVSSTVNPNYAYSAIKTFDIAKTAADGYLVLPPCVTGGSRICRDQGAVNQIVPLMRVGTTARNKVKAALRVSNGGPIPVVSYNTLLAINGTLQSVNANYGIR